MGKGEVGRASVFEVWHIYMMSQSTWDYHTATLRAFVKGVKQGVGGVGAWGTSGDIKGTTGELGAQMHNAPKHIGLSHCDTQDPC